MHQLLKEHLIESINVQFPDLDEFAKQMINDILSHNETEVVKFFQQGSSQLRRFDYMSQIAICLNRVHIKYKIGSVSRIIQGKEQQIFTLKIIW